MKNTILALSISSLLLSLTACGSDSQSGDKPTSSANPSATSSSPSEAAASSSLQAEVTSSKSSTMSSAMVGSQSSASNLASSLDGVWFKDCFAEDDFEEDTFYDTVELTFNNGRVATDIHVYTDSDCTLPMPQAPNPRASGTFTTGASFTSGDGVTVREIDVHLTKVNGAPFDVHSYNIFYIDGDQLYMAEDAETPEERPTLLDFSSAFIKQ